MLINPYFWTMDVNNNDNNNSNWFFDDLYGTKNTSPLLERESPDPSVESPDHDQNPEPENENKNHYQEREQKKEYDRENSIAVAAIELIDGGMDVLAKRIDPEADVTATKPQKKELVKALDNVMEDSNVVMTPMQSFFATLAAVYGFQFVRVYAEREDRKSNDIAEGDIFGNFKAKGKVNPEEREKEGPTPVVKMNIPTKPDEKVTNVTEYELV